MVFVSALNRLFWIAGEYKQRSQVMARALKEYLPGSYTAPAFGGGSFWITLPSEVDALELLRRCKHDSVWF